MGVENENEGKSDGYPDNSENLKNDNLIIEDKGKDKSDTLNLSFSFFKNKKVQNIILIVLLLAVIFTGVFLRLQILPNLIDPTTGDYTPLDLDSYYFLRVSETLIETNGILPEVDLFRYPGLNLPYTNELLPHATVFLYNIIHGLSPSATLNFVNVISSAIFFALGLIIFFFLVYVLTKNKWIALIGSAILAIIPPYLSRTLSSDHEPLGMIGFFLAFLAFSVGMAYLEKNKIKRGHYIWLGLLAGFFIFFSIESWGGGAKFLYMILPLAFILIWIIKKDKDRLSYIYFYLSWIIGAIAGAFIFGYEISEIVFGQMVSSTGILTFFNLGFIIVDTLFMKYRLIKGKASKYRGLISLGAIVVFASIFYQLFIGDLSGLLSGLIGKIVTPFGTERTALTVAENAQPYLVNWINQIGAFMFYFFLFGCFIIGWKIAKGIKKEKLRVIFTSSFILFLIGILFARISSDSVLNGTSFISSALLFLTFLFFVVSSVYTYLKSEWEIESRWILIASWIVIMTFSVRSAVRVFFAIAPIVAFIVPFALIEIGKFAKKSKDSLIKMISYLVLFILIITAVLTLLNYYNSSLVQAENSYPPYDADWQNAMSWVRNNTAEGSVFLHWWDYGYWVQTGGDRPTVTDGGHGNAYWTHMIARYVMTTPYPATAKSFMKAHNVSYFLMDPTDMGKYSAYSSIGDDENASDRLSYIPSFLSNPSENQESSNGTVRVYRGGFALDDDLILNASGRENLLPRGSAGVYGILVRKLDSEYSQPIGIFVYNNQQYQTLLRYLYVSGSLIDFGSGINSTVYIYPNVLNQQFDLGGAAIYLSEKTGSSLAAKLYLMDDPLDEYPELSLEFEGGGYPFNFYYNGFRGPIRIWKVNTDEMADIIARDEFLSTEGSYGQFDDLDFLS